MQFARSSPICYEVSGIEPEHPWHPLFQPLPRLPNCLITRPKVAQKAPMEAPQLQKCRQALSEGLQRVTPILLKLPKKLK